MTSHEDILSPGEFLAKAGREDYKIWVMGWFRKEVEKSSSSGKLSDINWIMARESSKFNS